MSLCSYQYQRDFKLNENDFHRFKTSFKYKNDVYKLFMLLGAEEEDFKFDSYGDIKFILFRKKIDQVTIIFNIACNADFDKPVNTDDIIINEVSDALSYMVKNN